MADPAAEMTVVIVSIVGGDALDRCISSVRALDATYLISELSGRLVDSEGKTLAEDSVRNVPSRRRRGAESAATPLVAFLEDTVVPGSAWLTATTDVLNAENVSAAGGPINISPDLPARYRALGLTEYARFHATNFREQRVLDDDIGSGYQVSAIAGANLAFRRADLLEVMEEGDGLIEHEVVDRLRNRGKLIAYAPSMQVTYREPFPAGARLATRFDHGRIFAGRLYAEASAGRRAAGMIKALFLPVVLTLRTARVALRSGQFGLAAMFWVTAMHLFWSAGELTGVVFGMGRDGVDRWQ